MMGLSLLGTKIGMTRVYTDDGVSVPVTAIKVGPCVVTQVKRADGPDGYNAVQIGYGELKPRNSTFPNIAHDAKAGTAPKRFHKEFQVSAKEVENFELGQELDASTLADMKFVDVVGTSKGKGFQGTMKRHNFKGLCASHGTERKHRSPGSISSNSSNAGTGALKRGIRMAGHMGDEQTTIRSVEIIRVDADKGLVLVKGPVPGAAKGMVEVRSARRLNRSKMNRLQGDKG